MSGDVVIRRVCVFCGSSPGRDPVFRRAAEAMAAALVARGWGLVYGGGDVGLMGVIADAMMAAEGEVIGVIPQALFDREVGHSGITQLHVVANMHQRKEQMYDLADAFVALPGGMGTLEELLETLTWIQLGLHAKPCGLLNVEGYYDPLLVMLDRALEHGFVRPQHRRLLMAESEPNRLLERFAEYREPVLAKWISEEDL